MRPDPPADPSDRRARVRSAAFVAAVAIAVYLPAALTNGFAWDDLRFIVLNPLVLQPDGWSGWLALFHDPSSVDPARPIEIVRPMRTFEFALDHALFRLSPAAFHLHSLLWHVTASVLALSLLRALRCASVAALAGATLFAVHPMQVEAVAFIGSRGDVAMGALTLASLLLALRSKGWDAALAAAVACGALATLYKETAVVLPLLVFAVRLVRPVVGPIGDVRGALRAAAPFVFVAAAYVAYRSSVQVSEAAFVDTFVIGGSTAGTFATMFRAVGAYAVFLIAPIRPALDWFLLPSTSLLDPAAAGWFIAHAAVIATAVVARRRHPRLAAATCFFYFPLIPVANWPFQIGIPTAERFLYVSVFAAALVLAVAVERLGRRAHVPLALVVIACASIAVTRTFDWHDTDSLLAAAHRHGGSPRAHSWRSARLRTEALAAERSGAADRATEVRREALAEAHAALRLVYAFEGSTESRSHIVIEPHVNAADLCLALGRDAEALWHGDRAVAAGAGLRPQIEYNRARALLRLQRGAAAHAAMARSRADGFDDPDPEFARVFVEAAHLAERDGLLAVAAAACRAALDVGAGPREMRVATRTLARVEATQRASGSVGVRARVAALVSTGSPDEWAAAGAVIEGEHGIEALLLRGVCAEEAGDDHAAGRFFDEWSRRSPPDIGGADAPERARVALALERIGRGCPELRKDR